MRLRKSLLLALLMACLLEGVPLSRAQSQNAFAIYGYFYVPGGAGGQAQMSVRLLTAKLYFPKERGKPLLLAYPDSSSSFAFKSLPRDSYLLEIYLGDQLLYQRTLKVESNVLLAIPVGNFKLIDKVTVQQRTKQPLSGDAFKGNVSIEVGNIARRLTPNVDFLPLTIYQGTKRIKSVRLKPPMLVTTFSYNDQEYILVGAIRTQANSEFMDCEIYR